MKNTEARLSLLAAAVAVAGCGKETPKPAAQVPAGARRRRRK